MDDGRIDFSQVRFRNPDVREPARREQETGTPFWRIVGAVFVALCLYGLLQTVVTVLVVRHAVEELERQFQVLLPDARTQGGGAGATPAAARSAARRPGAHALPAFPGPVAARRDGRAQACIGGYVSQRVDGGWSQTRQRCSAASE